MEDIFTYSFTNCLEISLQSRINPEIKLQVEKLYQQYTVTMYDENIYLDLSQTYRRKYY